MADWCTNAAIASAMVVGTDTVEQNVTAIFQKLGVGDSADHHRQGLAVLAWLQH